MNPFYPGKRVFRLQEVVQQCICSFESSAAHQHIQLQLADDLVEPLTLIGDDKPLREAISILMMAAAQFVGATEIVVSMKQLLQSGNNVLLEFEVKDNGASIVHDAKTSFFAYKRCMAQARSFITCQGGKYVINSLYGVGTSVKFLLKYAAVTKENTENISLVQRSVLKGKKILVAEENELNQKSLVHLLRREGMVVDIAEDGRRAVELMEKNKGYDLVLLELQLPFMDGFQSAVYIRKKLKSNIPIIALTAGMLSDTRSRCQETGINRYIKKPLKREELMKDLNFFFSVPTYQ